VVFYGKRRIGKEWHKGPLQYTRVPQSASYPDMIITAGKILYSEKHTKREGIMSQKKYKVTPTGEEETILHDIMSRGKHGAQKRELIPGTAPCRRRIHRRADSGPGRNA
jgi:hypothetical protein